MAAAVSSFTPISSTPIDETPPAGGAFTPISTTPIDESPHPETASRVAGLTGRALAEGGAGLAGTITEGALTALDPAMAIPLVGRHIADWMLEKLTGTKPTALPEPPLADLPGYATQAATTVANAAGLPTAQTPGERIYSAAARGLPFAALSPEAPVVGALSSAAGGAASQGVAEAGGGPVLQTLAGIVAGGAPAIGAAGAGAVRTVARGAGEEAASAAQQRIASAQATGVNLTAGQATGSHLLQMAEGASSKFWGGGPIKETAQAQAAGLGKSVEDIVSDLSQGTTPSPTAAGEAINKGAAAAKQSMRDAEKAAYAKVDTLVHPDTPVDVSTTLAKLDDLATPTAGAEATTGSLIPPRIATMRENLAADVAKNGGTLPYSAVRDLRSAVGREINPISTDPANGAFKQLYGTLTDDMNAGAAAVSPEAKQAVTAASSLYKANQNRRDFLDSIVDKAGGPEAVYQAATNGTKLGATKIAGVMGALDAQNQNMVQATVIDRLGRAAPSQQNAVGSEFNASTFLTNWAKMSPEAKNALFGTSTGPGNTLRRSLDALEETAGTIRKSTIYPNPSGTGEALGHGFGLLALLEGAGHAAVGNPSHLLGIGSGFALNAILSRALVNPRTAAWLAQTTKLPPSALPGAVASLTRMAQATNDPDARDLAAALQAR